MTTTTITAADVNVGTPAPGVAPALPQAVEAVRSAAETDPGLAHGLAGHYLTQFAVALLGDGEQRRWVGREAGNGRRFSWIGAPGRPAVAASLRHSADNEGWSLSAGPAPTAGLDRDGWLAIVARIAGSDGPSALALALVHVDVDGVSRAPMEGRPFGLLTVDHEHLALDRAAVTPNRVLRLSVGEQEIDLTLIDAIAQLLDAAVELGIGRAAIEETAARASSISAAYSGTTRSPARRIRCVFVLGSATWGRSTLGQRTVWAAARVEGVG